MVAWPKPHRTVQLACFLVVLLVGASTLGAPPSPLEGPPDPTPGPTAGASVDSLAGQAAAAGASIGAGIYFEPNQGQFPDHVRFVVRGGGTHAFLTDQGATFVLVQYSEAEPESDLLDPLAELDEAASGLPLPEHAWAVQMHFDQALPVTPIGQERLPGISNHFIGNDPDKWVTEVPQHARVVHQDVWPGIDVVWYGTKEGLKFDVVVAPGSDPARARFSTPGTQSVDVDAAGKLVMATPLGDLVKGAPVAVQPDVDGTVPVEYEVSDAVFGFSLGDYDRSTALIIDPLVYSTYLGGSEQDFGSSVAVDGNGRAYVAGTTWSSGFPVTPGAYQPLFTGDRAPFVARFDAMGSVLQYATYLGGTGTYQPLVGFSGDQIKGLDVGDNGEAVLTGTAVTNDFPTTTGAFQETKQGDNDAFVTRLSSTGSALVWSTYLGGESKEQAGSLVVADDQTVHVVGNTGSADFPVTSGVVQPIMKGSGDLFIAKLAADGSSLMHATYLGGLTGHAAGWDIALDATGNRYIMGETDSPDLPSTPFAFQPLYAGNWDAFVAKISPNATLLHYLTYLGGSDREWPRGGIAVMDGGDAYVYGITESGDFPTTAGAHRTSHYPTGHFGRDYFVTGLSPTGSSLVYSTYLGGTNDEQSGVGWVGYNKAIAVDNNGWVYIAGDTVSKDYPTTPGAFQSTLLGSQDVVVTILAPPWSGLVASTYIGGGLPGSGTSAAITRAGALVVDDHCSATLTGATTAADHPTTSGAQDTVHNGLNDVFVMKMFGCPPPPVAAFEVEPDPVCHNTPAHFTFLGSPGLPYYPLAVAEWELGDGNVRSDAPPGSFDHTYAAPGTYPVVLELTDVLGVTVKAYGNVTAVNCPPALDPLGPFTIYEEETLDLQVTGSDPNLDALMFNATSLPWGASFADTGFSWTPVEGQAGTYNVRFFVTDEYGMSNDLLVKIHVLATPPGGSHVPISADADGDGLPDLHDPCPLEAQAPAGCAPSSDEAGGLAPEGDAPGGACGLLDLHPENVTATWSAETVVVAWDHDPLCPVERYLVWNGTTGDPVAVVPAEGQRFQGVDNDPWVDPHRYWVQVQLAGEAERFLPDRAVPSNLVQGPATPLAGDDGVPVAPADQAPASGTAPDAGLVPAMLPWGLGALLLLLLLGVLWHLRHLPIVRLFSRIKREDVLEHPLRSQIAALVQAEPGIHFTDLQQRLGKGSGVARHHVKVLTSAGVIRERRTGRYVCYYPPEMPDRGLQEIGGLLRSDVARGLLNELARAPGQPVAALARRLHVRPSTVRYHLRRFEEAGLARVRAEAGASHAYPGGRAQDAIAAFTT